MTGFAWHLLCGVAILPGGLPQRAHRAVCGYASGIYDGSYRFVYKFLISKYNFFHKKRTWQALLLTCQILIYYVFYHPISISRSIPSSSPKFSCFNVSFIASNLGETSLHKLELYVFSFIFLSDKTVTLFFL